MTEFIMKEEQPRFDVIPANMNELSHIVMTRKKAKLLCYLCKVGSLPGTYLINQYEMQHYYNGVPIHIDDSIGEMPGWYPVYTSVL